jgi:molybdopterin molybdotransferase
MRPGSPLAFGFVGGTPWLGLPGNPVSALVTFTLFARPAILRLAGHSSPFAARVRVTAGEPVSLGGSLTHFLRVRLSPNGAGNTQAMLSGPQASNVLSALANASALMVVPAGTTDVAPGDEFDAIPL